MEGGSGGVIPPQEISRGICTRLTQWLWPGRWSLGGDSSTSTGLGGAPSGLAAASRPQLQIEPRASASLDCKACRERGIECDQTRPQCGKCYEQQTLCFYISPTYKTKRPTRTSRIKRVTAEEGNPDHLASSACLLACAATDD
ncbi:hypothetical protein PDE_06635 [Penicillium oxalicum 114-2]|uniref:Zn(2)-C6 fungal-type domain-containing protein n=1 Tax=Penicillium oxalicum (strain 114-2 / CGMCC 5302) TaxID=933388 RepID=S8AZ16_PENO1|nr:hypothetical protein PDE_06635 [Penicillium oxalicum 114-2]